MSFALIILGAIMLTAAIRNTQHCLVELIKGEFRGPGNFSYWVAGIIIIGIIGMSETLRPLSQGLLALILVALFLAKGTGVFARLTPAIKSTGTGGGGGSIDLSSYVPVVEQSQFGGTP